MLRRLLKFIILLIVVIGAAIGGTIFVMNRNHAANTPVSPLAQAAQMSAAAPIVPAPIFAELDPFTVTLYGETRNRILYTAITLRMGDEPSRKQIQDYMPEVRDRILKVLSTQQPTSVQAVEGRQTLSDNLKASLARPFAVQLPGPHVADVLFTAFVVQ